MDIDKNLIVIRGNSGSGKSTLANNLRELHKKRGLKVPLLEQDYIRRKILKEKDELDMVDSIELIKSMIATVSGLGYVIILEGLGYAIVAGHKATDLPRTTCDCPILAGYRAVAGIPDDYVPATETIASAIVDLSSADAKKLLVCEVDVSQVAFAGKGNWQADC